MLNDPSQDLKVDKHSKVYLVLTFLFKRFSCTHSLVMFAYVCFTLVCILFKWHFTHYHIVCHILVCVLCCVIRFPNMFGNVRACTDMCLVLREDRLRRMPLASPLVSPSLVKRRFDRRPLTAEWNRRLIPESSGTDLRLRSAVRPPNRNRRIRPDAFIILGFDSAV